MYPWIIAEDQDSSEQRQGISKATPAAQGLSLQSQTRYLHFGISTASAASLGTQNVGRPSLFGEGNGQGAGSERKGITSKSSRGSGNILWGHFSGIFGRQETV